MKNVETEPGQIKPYANKITKNQSEHEKTPKEKYIEIKEAIKIYHTELSESIMNGKKLDNEKFQMTFFRSLENLIQQLDLIKDEPEKSSKIIKIYAWYMQRFSFFNDLNPINKRSAKIYFETIPNISAIKKSEIFEARNYPIEFERDNRTEISSMLPPKDRLKEYLIKKINPKPLIKKQEKDLDDEIKKTTQRIVSGQSSVAPSTHYSTNFFNSTGSKFYQTTTNKFLSTANKFKLNNELDHVREIKSSYGYHRPVYDSNNLEIHKQFINEKNREVAEKRNQEEMKEFIHEWGFNKSKAIEEVERKQELKLLLKNYEKINYKAEGKHTENNVEEDDKDELIKINEEKEEEQNQLDDEFEGENTSIKMMIRKNLNIVNQTKGIQINNAKGSVDKKVNVIESMKHRFDKNYPLELNPMIANEKLLATRKMYGNLLEVPEIDNQKQGEYYSDYKSALSLYDNYTDCKIKDFSLNKRENPFNYKLSIGERPATHHEQVNPLRQRRTLSAFNVVKEIKELKKDLNSNNVNISLKTLTEGLVLPNASKYPKYFLPKPGFGLLKNPFPEKPKGRKRPASKKKI